VGDKANKYLIYPALAKYSFKKRNPRSNKKLKNWAKAPGGEEDLLLISTT
jgi:hypothetical protein